MNESTGTAGLRHELTELRKRRQDTQRRAAERGTLERSLALVARDRSALSSPPVQQLRDHAQADLDELVDLWVAADRVRRMISQVRTHGRHLLPDTDALDGALAAEAEARSRFAALAAEAGLPVTVPDPGSTDPAPPDPTPDPASVSGPAAGRDH